MWQVVGVKFKKAGKLYYFNPGALPLKLGKSVIVETSRGQEYGEVVTEIKELPKEKLVLPLKNVLRLANESDYHKVMENRSKEEEYFDICLQKIENHNLGMKLTGVEYTFDRSKLIFYFTADGRVDFRELVKDLALAFRTRIELRQIGVRDEAKMIGGLGICGRVLCCSTFLGDFEPVSIRMAKEQNLSLNPAKISGVCGRLMCCLRYEVCTYKKLKEDFPREGESVLTPEGAGKVQSINVIKRTIRVRIEETGRSREFSLPEIEETRKKV